MRALWQILVGIVRELSDENAYDRHLKVHGKKHSAEAWRHFHEHRLASKYTRAKCC